MALRFEEIDWQQTDQGEISLRRRHDLVTDSDVYEVKLGEEFLMSSLFTAAEIELSHLALAEIDRPRLRVMVGGLGLGYTAQAALADPRVAEVTVVELNEPVLEWHRRGLLPDVVELGSDPRCQLVQDDFFRLAATEPERTYDAILLDIDHSPHHALSPTHQAFYTALEPRRAVPSSHRRRRLRAVVGRPTRSGVRAVLSGGVLDRCGPRRRVRQPAHRWRLEQHRLCCAAITLAGRTNLAEFESPSVGFPDERRRLGSWAPFWPVAPGSSAPLAPGQTKELSDDVPRALSIVSG